MLCKHFVNFSLTYLHRSVSRQRPESSQQQNENQPFLKLHSNRTKILRKVFKSSVNSRNSLVTRKKALEMTKTVRNQNEPRDHTGCHGTVIILMVRNQNDSILVSCLQNALFSISDTDTSGVIRTKTRLMMCKRGTMRAKCLVQEHNSMTPARGRTWQLFPESNVLRPSFKAQWNLVQHTHALTILSVFLCKLQPKV